METAKVKNKARCKQKEETSGIRAGGDDDDDDDDDALRNRLM